MKIAVISDTHIARPSSAFMASLKERFREADMIIHAGDFVSLEVVESLKMICPLLGVRGNVDDFEVKTALKEKETVTVEGYKIGVFHGHGGVGSTQDRAYDMFREDLVDIIIFGHSHQPVMTTKNGILMLNPGSSTNKRRERWFSYILLELCPGEIDVCFNLFTNNL